MKTIVLICLVTIAVGAWTAPVEDGDHTSVEEILENRRLLVAYIKCVLDQGKCTSRGKTLRANISDSLKTHCGKCTPSEKKDSDLILKHVINHEQDYWKQIGDKYDPEGSYVASYEKEYKQ